MSNATVSIPYSEFQEIQEAKQKAEMEAAKLQEQIRSTKIGASDPIMLALSRAAVEVIRFAIANLPPESIRGWPVKSLREIALMLPSMPDATSDDKDLSVTIASFAEECARYEERRRSI